MIHADTSELRKSFHNHRHSANPRQNSSHYLLLFYAVECGLKCAYLRENELCSTESIDHELFRTNKHDISRWSSELRVPAHRIYPPKNFRYLKRIGQCQLNEIHEAWRYGILINRDDEKAIVTYLENLESWIKEEYC
jgi:hypothetical protein